MRSRPRLDVSLSGPRHGGSELVAHIELTARSETPIDAIDVVLLGRMTRYARTTTIGTMSSDQWEDARLVGLHARLEGGTLSGKRTSRVSFDLPDSLPPTFRCATTRIEYTLDVHVSIPWWPDRRTIYEVPIGLPPRPVSAPAPLQSSTLRTGEKTLGIELSLADRVLVPGEACDGAVSLHNLLGRSIRRIEVSLVGKDEARFSSARAEVEVLRSTATTFGGTPAEGAPLPFRVVFPAELTPSFETPLMALRHYFEVRVVVAWSADLVVFVPVTVVPAGSPAGIGASLARGRRVPPVGSERRRLVWTQLGQGGVDFDAETERLHWLSGSVRGTTSVEQRANQGLWTVATLRWPSLGIGLRASNRAWHHRLRGPVPVADPAVKERLTVLGREAAQTAAFFDLLGDAPAAFEEAAFDDEGCVVASPGGGFAREEVERFVEAARRLAIAVDEARAAMVAPAPMAAHIGAWRAFTERVGGVVHLGEPRIEGALVSGEPIEITTVWDDEELVATELAVLRRARLADDEDEAPAVDVEASARLPAHARAVLDPAVERGGTLEADATHLRLRLPGPLPDPARVEPLLEALAVWAKALRMDAERGPYR